MSDSKHKCPLCGRDTDEDEIFCHDCQEIAQNAYPDELLSRKIEDDGTLYNEIVAPVISESDSLEEDEIDGDAENNEGTRKTPPPSNRKLLIFLFVGLVVLVLVGGIGSYVFLQNKNAEETEVAYWNRCIDENTPLSYAKYLVQYPEGKFTQEAQDRIKQLRESEKTEWQTLRNSKDIDALSAFLRDHPETPYIRDIKHAIDSLAWVIALDQNTIDAYKAYISNVQLERYSGEYFDQAQQKANYLTQLKTIEGDELKDIKKRLQNFFKALGSVNGKDIQKMTTPILLNLNKSQNQSNELITDSVKAYLKNNKIRNISYSPILDSLQVIKDNKDKYFIHRLTVKTETSYADRKKKKLSQEHHFGIELNDQKMIQSLYPVD